MSFLVTQGTPTQRFSIEMSVDEVEHLFEKTLEAVQGPSLEALMIGPVHKYFETEIVNRFAYQGDRVVGHWPDLAEATQNIRQDLGFAPEWPINIRTEEMFHTVTQEADFDFTPNSAEMVLPGRAGEHGLVAQKIEHAQMGATDNTFVDFSGNQQYFSPTPPRPVLGADEQDLVAVVEIIERWVVFRLAGGAF